MPTGWRLWVLVGVTVFFPILFHPGWLLILSAAAYFVLIWLLFPKKENSK
jgi:hypothetical protein